MFQCTRDNTRWICGRNSKEEMLLPWKCRWLVFVDLLGYRLGHPSAEAVAGVAAFTIAAAPYGEPQVKKGPHRGAHVGSGGCPGRRQEKTATAHASTETARPHHHK
jgi:hypothetical protein